MIFLFYGGFCFLNLCKYIDQSVFPSVIKLHCVKRIRIGDYSGPYFSRIFPHSDFVSLRIQSECGKNADQNNCKYGNFYAVPLHKRNPKALKTITELSVFCQISSMRSLYLKQIWNILNHFNRNISFDPERSSVFSNVSYQC